MSESDTDFEKLLDLMATLRGPQGCPWDREQTRETLKPMLIEEAFEVLDALDGPPDELCEELGDLLFQVVFHSEIAREKGEFDAREVCKRLYEKMVRRHPHVFGDAKIENSQELLKEWEDIKASEKKAAGGHPAKKSLLDGVPSQLPAIYEAHKLTDKASRVGFDWPDLEGIRDKFLEEFEEVQVASRTESVDRLQEEVGDLLFTALNVSRYLSIDPETALRRANQKFSTRFRKMEEFFLSQGRALKEVDPVEMEAIWQENKIDSDCESAVKGEV